MIVKDEEANLVACIESVRTLVDEIVVVDTGSRDGTVELARALGARVFSFAWNRDFSAARNESLRHARGEWVLYLDADERLNPDGMGDCLRRAAAVPGVDAYSTPIKNRRNHRGQVYFQVVYNVRMFRRYPGIRFSGEVHERVEPFLEKVNANIAQAGFFIEHLGYDIERAEEVKKLERNLDLTRKALERDPDDGYALYYLGLTLLGLQRMEESREALENALEARGLTPNLKALILNLLSYHHILNHCYSQAVRRATESLGSVPVQNTARLFLGFALFQQNDYPNALPHLLRVNEFLRLPPEKRTTRLSQEHSIQEADLWKMIGVCFLQTQDFPRALEYLRKYAIERAQDAEAHRLVGVCALNCQEFDLALDHLTTAKRLGIPADSLSLPLAYAHLRAGDPSRALRYFEASRETTEEEIAASLQILECFARSPDAMPLLPSLLEKKRSVLARASRGLLDRLLGALADARNYDALVRVLEGIPAEGDDFEALLRGIEVRFGAQGRHGDWVRFLEEFVRARPQNPTVGCLLGTARIRAGDFPKAIEAFTRVRGQCPPEAGVDRILAGLFLKVGDPEKARYHLALSRTAASSAGK